MIDKEMQPGDMVQFTQDDGNRLVVIASTDGLIVKADNPGTVLDEQVLTLYSKFVTAKKKGKRT